jgi:hypothetical protein
LLTHFQTQALEHRFYGSGAGLVRTYAKHFPLLGKEHIAPDTL